MLDESLHRTDRKTHSEYFTVGSGNISCWIMKTVQYIFYLLPLRGKLFYHRIQLIRSAFHKLLKRADVEEIKVTDNILCLIAIVRYAGHHFRQGSVQNIHAPHGLLARLVWIWIATPDTLSRFRGMILI